MAKNFFSSEETLLFPSEDIFSMLIDIEKYPIFLTWCKKIEIINKIDNIITAKVYIKFVSTSVSYICTIRSQSPETNINKKGVIEIEARKGVFKYLFSKWEIVPIDNGSSHVQFSIVFEFRSFFFQKILNVVYIRAQKNIITSFRNRLDMLKNM